MNKKIRELTKICVKWNARTITPKDAMQKIWELFKTENMREWRKQIEERKQEKIKKRLEKWRMKTK